MTSLTLGDVMSLHGDAFITAAFTAIIDRAPDPKGLAFYRWRLREGLPKRAVIFDLATSREARGEALATVPLRDDEYLEALYRQILNRPSDEQGRAHFLPKLKSHGRDVVALDLRYSDEACARKGIDPSFRLDLQRLMTNEKRARGWRRLFRDQNMERQIAQLSWSIGDVLSRLDEIEKRGTRNAARKLAYSAAHPDFKSVAMKMDSEGEYGRLTSSAIGRLKLDDYIVGSYGADDSPSGKCRWIGSSGTIYIEITGKRLSLVGAGVFENRVVSLTVGNHHLGEFEFEKEPSEVTVSVAEWIGNKISLGIHCERTYNDAKVNERLDWRDLGLQVHSIYCH